MTRLRATGARALLALAPTVALTTLLLTGSSIEAWAEGNETWFSAQFSTGQNASAGTKQSPRRQARSSLGGPVDGNSQSRSRRRESLSGGTLSWQASSGCLSGQLRGVLENVAASFGPVTVTSTCRSRAQNRAAGGADQSYHLKGEAVDFRTHGSTGAVYAYLSSSGSVGGLKHYGGGLFHVDTGPRRSW